MSALRSITALPTPGITPGGTPSARPIFEWVDPATLLVDGTYQRSLAERSLRLIRKIVQDWDWRRFKAPVVVLTDNGLEIIDGQHTAIAAASHPDVPQIPVMIVEATELEDRANAFLGHNRDRLNVTAIQMHVAEVAAGDERAAKVERLCAAVGVTIKRTQPKQFQPRETVAVSAIGAGRDDAFAARGLRILSDAGLAPIAAPHIKAVDHLLSSEEFDGIDDARLTAAIQTLGELEATRQAKTFAATHCVPLWKALASVWFQSAKKQRRVVVPADTPLARVAQVRAREGRPGCEGEPKRDVRPARGDWQPGPIARRCRCCDCRFEGGLSARLCADCAYERDEF